MRGLGRWVKRLVLGVILLIAALLAPVVYVETMCRGDGLAAPYAALLPPEQHRQEARTLLTYPEWHIVHAYDDYAKVISTGDPHDFGFFRAIRGFWSSLCTLHQQSAQHGGFDGDTKQTIYVIGVSFSAELALKAIYEETVGRVFVALRGPARTPLEALSADQAGDYAKFLQQVPWYQWDFATNAQVLADQASDSLRDQERAFALGVEYRAKAAYAGAIKAAVAGMAPDALRLRMVVKGLDADQLAGFSEVQIIERLDTGVVVETPRYRKLTVLLDEMAKAGADLVEIAGNDDIMFTATSLDAEISGAMHSFARQGYVDYRHLMMVKVADLAETLTSLPKRRLILEHIHDY